MDASEALLESWTRQCRIVEAVASRIDESNRGVKPSPDGWPLDKHLAHVQLVRRYWLSQVSPSHAKDLADLFGGGWETPTNDLDAIKSELAKSGLAIGEAMRELLSNGTQSVGGYDHPVLFLGHMIWHEGWHVGLLMLGLRLAGMEPSEEWEETHLWGEWRVE